VVKSSSNYYLNPPKVGELISISHLGFFPKSQKFKHPVMIEFEEE
jgi:hypothetical protein